MLLRKDIISLRGEIMKKGIILSFLLIFFVLCGVKTSAKFDTSQFVPQGINYMDPYNFYYAPITKNKHGYIKTIRMFNVSNLDEIAVGVVDEGSIDIVSFAYTSYNYYQYEIGTFEIEV